MELNIIPFLVQGINLGLGILAKSVPGGSVAFSTACDALELGAKMLLAIVPKVRDGNLSSDEFDGIVKSFKTDIPEGTFTMALKIVKSALDRVIGTISK
jgi:hypothetical protein